jgi:hypothetical protein
MADIYRNQFARGFRGTFSKELVVHQTGSGKTIVTSKPLFDENLIHTEKLTMHQAAIRDAAIYASFAEHEEVYIRMARATGSTAYALAVADWYAAPRVLEIDLDHWTGNAGETIRVKARDSVMVASVMLIIRDQQGQVLEMGEATLSQAGSPWWNYTTQTPVPLQPFPSVQAIAFDLPGNRDSFIIH